MAEEHTVNDHEERLKQLKQLARERWGDRWTITQKHFADGTTKLTAWRSFGPVDIDTDGRVFEQERIRFDGERVLHDHVYQRNDEVVKSLDEEICAINEISALETLSSNSE